jgi:hypothetical protein
MGEPVGKSVRRDWTDLPCCVVGFSVNPGGPVAHGSLWLQIR